MFAIEEHTIETLENQWGCASIFLDAEPYNYMNFDTYSGMAGVLHDIRKDPAILDKNAKYTYAVADAVVQASEFFKDIPENEARENGNGYVKESLLDAFKESIQHSVPAWYLCDSEIKWSIEWAAEQYYKVGAHYIALWKKFRFNINQATYAEGYAYVDRKAIINMQGEEWLNKHYSKSNGFDEYAHEIISRAVECEIDQYRDWKLGKCYGYIVEDKDGDVIDVSWGYIGDDGLKHATQVSREIFNAHVDEQEAKTVFAEMA